MPRSLARPFPIAQRRRGAALMMVLVLLSLLLILAVSFAFLMTQQEGTSVASLAGEDTRIAARTGADHAYARLNSRNRLNEFAQWWNTRPDEMSAMSHPWWSDPSVDSYDEALVDLLYDFEGGGGQPPMFSGLQGADGQPFRVEDPRRLVLGITIQDESGKVNLNHSSAQLIANLIGSATAVSEVKPQGEVYSPVVLTDASFLTPYDEDANPADNRYGGGFVVIDGHLFSYASRVGNTLIEVIPNPQYNSPGRGASELGLFPHWTVSPDHVIPRGAFVCSPTAYKIAYRRYLEAGTSPALFGNLGEVRRIAEMPRWFEPAGMLGPYIMGQKLTGWPEGVDPVTYQHLERLATVSAPTERFDGGWFYPHIVRGGEMVTDRRTGKSLFLFNYERDQAVQPNFYVFQDPRNPNPSSPTVNTGTGGIGPGNLVRFRHSDGRVFYGVIASAGQRQATAWVGADQNIGWGEAWLVECAERAEVNINTAPLEVLEAVFHGIGPQGQDPEDHPITRQQARAIALAILARVRGGEPFTGLPDLDTFLVELSQSSGAPISQDQRNAFLSMQRFPYAGHRIFTAKFSYSSLDSYMVDSYATRYQPTGGVMARRAFREWVGIGSDRPQVYIWRNYLRWMEEMRVPQGNVIALYDGGTGTGTTEGPGSSGGRMVGVHELPFLHYQADERYMRQRLDPPWGTPQTRDINAMGVNTQRRERFYDQDTLVTHAAGHQVGDLDAGMFSFWYRPQWEGANQNHYLFDAAEQPYSNRLGMLWWGQRTRGYRLAQRNSGLVLRLKDRTLEPAFTELRYELDANTFRTGDWYHFNVNWKGTQLSQLNLLMDGDAVTGSPALRPQLNHTFIQDNGAWVSRTSTLLQELEDPRQGNMQQTEIYLDPADVPAFPQRGVVVIGDEAIEYNGNNGFALLGIYRGPPVPNVQNSARGARGTNASFHPRGSRVTVYGYTSPVRSWQAPGNNANNRMLPRFPHIPATGGNSRSAMGNRGIYRVSRNGGINPNYYRPVELGPDAGFPGGVGAPGEAGDAYHLPLADYTGLQERGIVAVFGFGWRGYHPPGTPGIPQAGVWFPDFDPTQPGVERTLQVPVDLKFEYVVYDRITPQGLHVLQRLDENFVEKDPSLWWHFMGTYPTGANALIQPTNPSDPTNVNQINFFSAGTCVVPISIDIDNATGYHYVPAGNNIGPFGSVVQLGNEWFFYNRVWDPQVRAATDLLTLLIMDDFNGVRQYVIQHANQDNQSPTPFPRFRGWGNTGFHLHPAALPVTPCFATTIRTGEQDVVTAINGKNYEKALHRIRRQVRPTELAPYLLPFMNQAGQNSVVGPDGLWGTLDDLCIAAFYNHCSVNYLPNNTWQPVTGNFNPHNGANLCKFPTGELPVELPTSWTFAGADPRAPESTASAADFDSFEMRAYNIGAFRLAQTMTETYPGEGGEIQVSFPFPSTVNTIKINDELIVYRGSETRQGQIVLPNGQTVTTQTYWLTDITRAVLGTLPGAHSIGSPIMNMASVRVAKPVNPAGMQQNEMVVMRGDERMRPYGFVRIVDGPNLEIAGYQRSWESATPVPNTNPVQTQATVTMMAGYYNDPAHSQALFRGLYGTQARAYSTRALFFDQPVRFPDFFPGYHLEGRAVYGPWHQRQSQGIPGARSPEIAHVQGSATFRNSVFTDFKWRMAWLPHAVQERYEPALGARLVIRFRDRGVVPDWGEVPTNRPGGLYSFEFDFSGPKTESLGATAFEQTEDFTAMRATPAGIRADGIEWRVYLYFKENAFRDDLYKATLQFQGASTTVNQLTQVYRHEEKR